MLKVQVRAVADSELRMLLKTISCAHGASGWEPRWEPHG
jgi:hypothetical protein